MIIHQKDIAKVQLLEWQNRAIDSFNEILERVTFPCTLGLAGYKKKLLVYGFISENSSFQTLSNILSEYLSYISQLDSKTGGLSALVVFIETDIYQNLDYHHKLAWLHLKSSMEYDEKPIPNEFSLISDSPQFAFCYGGDAWFVNISAPSHNKRQSRNLGSAIVLAMQPLNASNLYFNTKIDKIKTQEVIRNRVLQYDGMETHEGLGPLIDSAPPRPLVESYGIPDTNLDSQSRFWIDKKFVLDTLIFDLDGTLLDSEFCSVLATQEAFKEFGISIPSLEVIRSYMGIPVESSFMKMGKGALNKENIDEIIKVFRYKYAILSNNSVKTFEGAVKTLAELRAYIPKMAIVTSKRREVAERELKSVGILELFDVIVGSDDVDNYKPNPQAALKAFSKLNCDNKDHVLVIGDAITDIQMGKAAGMKTCAVTWGAHSAAQLLKEEPDIIISSFLQLKKIIISDNV